MESSLSEFNRWMKILKDKWKEIPGGDINRINSIEMETKDPKILYCVWKDALERATKGEYFSVRGWYHELYKDILKGKKVLDVGSGLGIDGIFFAQNGAHVTFVDIVESNLNIISQICSFLCLENVSFIHLKDLSVLTKIKSSYDFIWAQGSLINAPSDVIKEERKELVKLLASGGRWIELAYPKTRWIKEGKLPFEVWGDKTDGGAPWIEWYDLEKLKKSLAPAKFETVLCFEFFNNDFIWFDLLRSS